MKLLGPALGAAMFATLAAAGARAEVSDRSAAGFEVVQSAAIAAPPEKVWRALLQPGRWWSSRHTWSGDARNLRLDPSGCFCEALRHGYARHMTVIYNDGASTLRLNGGLGPMQMTGASGNLGFVLKASGGGTVVTATYDVGGYAKGGLAETLAGPVDAVLGEQLRRLARYVETGAPE